MENEQDKSFQGRHEALADKKFGLSNIRSMLITPATSPERFSKAAEVGVDALVVDLEDGVAFGQKGPARSAALEYFSVQAAVRRHYRCLRINSLHTLEGFKDITALIDVGAVPDAILLAKTETAAEIKILEEILVNEFEPVFLFALIETARGMEAVSEIALSSPRLAGLVLGGADLAAELKAEMDWNFLLYPRARLVQAAALARIGVLDVPYLAVRDQDDTKFKAELMAIQKLGFTGKVAIHPRHIPAIHMAFTPPAPEVERARRIVAAFEASQGGVCVVDGRMVDRPVVQGAYRILKLAER